MMNKSFSVRSVEQMSRKRESSFLKGRHKGWFALELILVISALILSIYNIIQWGKYSPVLNYSVSLLLGLFFITRGISGRLRNEKYYKFNIIFGIIFSLLALSVMIVFTMFL